MTDLSQNNISFNKSIVQKQIQVQTFEKFAKQVIQYLCKL